MPIEKIVTVPSNPNFPQIPRREGEVTVKPNAKVSAQIQMESVGATSLSASVRAANP